MSEKENTECSNEKIKPSNGTGKYQKMLNAFSVGILILSFFVYKISIQFMLMAFDDIDCDNIEAVSSVDSGVNENLESILLFVATVTVGNIVKEYQQNRIKS